MLTLNLGKLNLVNQAIYATCPYQMTIPDMRSPPIIAIPIQWVTQVLMADIKIPCTYEDVMNHLDSNAWLEVCTDELGTLRETNTYIPVCESKADPHNVVGCQWVFTIKKNANGNIECYKAHIISKCSLLLSSGHHILLALATQSDLEVHQMDVKTAFLNGKLEHEIFMHPLPGCANYGWKDIVWKLRKSLYGLKQALQAWYTKAKDDLKKLSFTCLNSDHAVFTHSSNSKFCIIALYVNDLMILSNDLPSLQKKNKQLMLTFKMKDLGEIHWFLGLEIT